MTGRLRAARVDAVLAHSGYEPSEYDPQAGWDPGYRIVQRGPRLVHVFCDGPDERQQLGLYAEALKAAGYVVIAEQQSGGGRHRLAVTQP